METHNSSSSYTVQKQPNNPEAEQAFISLAIHSPVYLEKMEEENIDSSFYYNDKAGQIIETVYSLRSELKGAHPTPGMIRTALLKLPNQREYLNYLEKAITTVVPRNDSFYEMYRNRLVDARRKREYIRAALEIQAMAMQEAISSEEINKTWNDRQEEIDHIMKPMDILHGARLETELRKYYEDAPNQPGGASWGLKGLDKYTGGTRLGEFSLLYAPPGFGKSSLFLQAAYYRARMNRPQLYITVGDMTFQQDFNRIFQQETGVSSLNLARGNFADSTGFDHWNKIDSQLSALKDIPFFIYQDNMLQSSDVRRLIKSVIKMVPFVDVYIDHMGQFTDKAENIYVKTVEVSGVLLRCAHDLKNSEGQYICSINAISPINKGNNLVGANDLKHAAENIYMLEPALPTEGGPNKDLDPGEQSGIINLKIEKNRNGGAGTVPLFFNAPKARFYDVDKTRK